jgi:hypothetical protein
MTGAAHERNFNRFPRPAACCDWPGRWSRAIWSRSPSRRNPLHCVGRQRSPHTPERSGYARGQRLLGTPFGAVGRSQEKIKGLRPEIKPLPQVPKRGQFRDLPARLKSAPSQIVRVIFQATCRSCAPINRFIRDRSLYWFPGSHGDARIHHPIAGGDDRLGTHTG